MATASKSNFSAKEEKTSSTATFRLNSNVLRLLQEEAEQKRTSLNTLVAQVLQSHAEYHSLAPKAGMISMPKGLLVRLMDRLSPQEVIKLSEHIAKNDFKDTVIMMKNRCNLSTIVDFIDAWARAGGYPFKHNIEDIENGRKQRHSFVIQHEMGERWSLHLVELYRFAFEQLGARVDFQHTANTISFDVEF